MPQATDLIIKNAANQDKTFALITPAAGDGGIARWALKEGTISSVFPTITSSATATSRNARNAHIKIHVPSSYTDSVTGLTNVAGGPEANIKVAVPNDFPEAMKPDWVAYVVGAVQTALIQAVIKDATPAT